MRKWFLMAAVAVAVSMSLLAASESAAASGSKKSRSGIAKYATSGKNVPQTVAFTRVAEPREHAFTMLVPRGWIVEGGIFRVDPNRTGGTGNSIEAKCDIAVKSDAAGTIMLRRLPKINYADGPMLPPTHGPGMNYNGMTVVRMPGWEDYLLHVFSQTRAGATNARVVQKEPLPKLAELFSRLSEPVARALMQVGIQPPTYQAGFIIVEYTENGRAYKELLYTVLVDARRSMALWANDFTTTMRSPAGEVDQWKPVLDIIGNSVRLNPQWVAGEMRGQGERAEISRKVLQDLSRIDREITAHRSKTQQSIQKDQYLTLTSQEDYVNPITGKVERDTSDWSRRWVNANGDYIYSNDTGYNPNRDPSLPRQDFRLTRPRR
ncbi:MAG: hypothetical protein CVU61_13405 [Deltaproteobacteria bacterium HGW-Deltaproteobacteria-19]|jgi:hypothetical protein|nr:MAG: hypothetical protein CVU61_13405 [Deltaproteobacteria bacterium HGW-Deltaproteobacteria-19]